MPNYRKEFAKIYDKNVEKIYRFVFLKIGSREMTEDLTAQVFTKGWKKYSRGGKIDNPSAYLYQIARAEIANHYRKESKFRIVSTETVPVIDSSPSIEENLQFQSELEALRESLNQLNENHQDVLIWRHIEGFSIREIAEMIGKTEEATRAVIHRALKGLRGKMRDRPESEKPAKNGKKEAEEEVEREEAEAGGLEGEVEGVKQKEEAMEQLDNSEKP